MRECKLYIYICNNVGESFLERVENIHYTGSYFGLFQPCSSVYRSTLRLGLNTDCCNNTDLSAWNFNIASKSLPQIKVFNSSPKFGIFEKKF